MTEELLDDEQARQALEPEAGDDQDKDDDHPDDDEDSGEEHSQAKTSDEGDSDEDGDDREAIRERRRRERQDRKQRQKDAFDTLRRELAARDQLLNQMSERLAGLETGQRGSQIAAIDNAIGQATAEYEEYRSIVQEAVSKGNGEVMVKAQELMTAAQIKRDNLSRAKQQMSRQIAAPQSPHLDPRLVANAKSWMEKNSWYNPNGDDLDSRIALQVDQELAKQGFDSTTPEFWEELDSRLKKYLPHRYQKEYDRGGNKTTRSPVSSSSRESGAGNKRDGFTLSEARVSALKEAGLWDDPAKRAKAIEQYKNFDKQNSVRN